MVRTRLTYSKIESSYINAYRVYNSNSSIIIIYCTSAGTERNNDSKLTESTTASSHPMHKYYCVGESRWVIELTSHHFAVRARLTTLLHQQARQLKDTPPGGQRRRRALLHRRLLRFARRGCAVLVRGRILTAVRRRIILLTADCWRRHV